MIHLVIFNVSIVNFGYHNNYLVYYNSPLILNGLGVLCACVLLMHNITYQFVLYISSK